jgi:hypothetical protein
MGIENKNIKKQYLINHEDDHKSDRFRIYPDENVSDDEPSTS